MIIETLEDLKKMKLYTVLVERWHVNDPNLGVKKINYNGTLKELGEEDYFLLLIIQPYDFRNADLDYFDEFSENIIGKNAEQFLQWLEQKSAADLYVISDILENEASLFPDDYIVEKCFNEETNEKVIGVSELFDIESFELANAQPYSIGGEFFISLEDASDFICEHYPFFKD